MAMQQSGKGAASGSGPNPTLSDEQAEQFAASFTPAWDADDGSIDDSSGAASATQNVDAAHAPNVPPVVAAAPAVAAPAPAIHPNATLIGTAPQANAPVGAPAPPPVIVAPVIAVAPAPAPAAATNRGAEAASSEEAIDPDNILETDTAPARPDVRQAPPKQPAKGMHGTQLMDHAPGRDLHAAQAQARSAPAAAPRHAPAPVARNAPRAAVTADPFSSSSSDLDEFVPKKSNKTILLAVGGLVFAASLGLFLKFALTDDTPKPPPVQQVTGPAVTTAEIPPPPPADTPIAPPTTATTTAAAAAAATTAKVEPVAPTPLAAPATPAAPAAPVNAGGAAGAARNEPKGPRTTPVLPPPQAAAPPPVAPVAPKSAPKGPNGGIVRDNPF